MRATPLTYLPCVRLHPAPYAAGGYRKYQRTAVSIISPAYWRPLNGLAAPIGMPLPYQIRSLKLRNGTLFCLRSNRVASRIESSLLKGIPLMSAAPVIATPAKRESIHLNEPAHRSLNPDQAAPEELKSSDLSEGFGVFTWRPRLKADVGIRAKQIHRSPVST